MNAFLYAGDWGPYLALQSLSKELRIVSKTKPPQKKLGLRGILVAIGEILQTFI